MKIDNDTIFWRIKEVYGLFDALDSFEEDPAIWRIANFFEDKGIHEIGVIGYRNSYRRSGNEDMASIMQSFWELFYSLGEEMRTLIRENKTRLI